MGLKMLMTQLLFSMHRGIEKILSDTNWYETRFSMENEFIVALVHIDVSTLLLTKMMLI